jgi:radical SAM superfamily enzyme YgiQ (UPF0313 family)
VSSLSITADSSKASGRRVQNPFGLDKAGMIYYYPPLIPSNPKRTKRTGSHFEIIGDEGRVLGVVPCDKAAKKVLRELALRKGLKSISLPEISFKLNQVAFLGKRKLVLVDAGKRGDSIYGKDVANGLQVLSKVARDQGFAVEIFHLNSDSVQSIIDKIKPGDIVGLSSTSPGHEHAMSFINKLKALKSKVLIVKGGKHESFAGADLQSKSNYPVDISFLGDADQTLPMLLDLFKKANSLDLLEIQQALEKIPGIAYAGRKNLASEVRALGKNMVLPEFVDYRVSTPFSNFRNPDPDHQMLRIMDMRGCPEACTFCSISSLATRMKPEDLVSHIKEQIDAGYQANPPVKIAYIMFEDGTFATSPKQNRRISFDGQKYDTNSWLKSFSEQMISLNKELKANYGHALKFGIQTRSDSFEENLDLLSWLKDAGLESVYLGVETLSSDPKDLQRLGKRTFRSTNLDAINKCHKAGVNVTASVMCELGREEKAIKTIEELMKLGVNEIFTEFRKVYPDTADASRVIDHNGKPVSAREISRRYSTGELHYGLPGKEDAMNLIVQAVDPSDPYSKLQVVDINELKESSARYYASLAKLPQELGYKTDAYGHYLKI